MKPAFNKGLLTPLAIFSAAFLLNAFLFLELKSCPLFFEPEKDMLWHWQWANEIAIGNFGGDSQPFFRVPLYPYFLAPLVPVLTLIAALGLGKSQGKELERAFFRDRDITCLYLRIQQQLFGGHGI